MFGNNNMRINKSYKKMNVVVISFFALFVFVGYFLYKEIVNTQHAKNEGFQHMDSVELTGTDKVKYKVDIYWNDLVTIPGEHKIMAKIWKAETVYNVQHFTSGNRLNLKSISVKKNNGIDYLILSFKPMPSNLFSRYSASNTIKENQIIGHPQSIKNFAEQLH